TEHGGVVAATGFPDPLAAGPAPRAGNPLRTGERRRARVLGQRRGHRRPLARTERDEVRAQVGAHLERQLDPARALRFDRHLALALRPQARLAPLALETKPGLPLALRPQACFVLDAHPRFALLALDPQARFALLAQ